MLTNDVVSFEQPGPGFFRHKLIGWTLGPVEICGNIRDGLKTEEKNCKMHLHNLNIILVYLL